MSLSRGTVFTSCAILVAALLLLSCGRPTAVVPAGSYTLPTAIIGLQIQSAAEAQEVKSELVKFAARYRLQRYRPIEEPFFAAENARVPSSHLERETGYGPSIENAHAGKGFSISLTEYSADCLLVSVSDYTGIWKPVTLQVVDELKQRLVEMTEGRAMLLVRPKPSQNWPAQQSVSDPERPKYLAQLCVRMGLPVPRSPDEVTTQGPLG